MSGFVGIVELKAKHAAQTAHFEAWAAEGLWTSFHLSHYDWWAFPISRGSRAYGDLYKLEEKHIEVLKLDEEFRTKLKRNIELLALSWGWDLYTQDFIPNPGSGQSWAKWPIRLKKAVQSASLFGLREECSSLLIFADRLYESGQLHKYNKWFNRLKAELAST